MQKQLSRLLVTASLLILAACSGSSSSTPALMSVSGTVSGLSASGLVLANGSITVTVASDATSFTFGSTFTQGMTYAVTVKTQPTAQVCSVANGSGTITADVTNIAVTCAKPTFELGGTVSGLTASGLVLANGSDTLTVASGATSFTFDTTLTQGTTYAVTVKTQPTNKTCSVANGSGTIATASVTNVVVTCANSAFSLGGTVSGLTTSGLVLANGSSSTTIAANATTFTLPTSVAVGSSYNVAVQTQPTGLACAVTHGSGTMPSSAVTNVAVTCTDQPFTLGGTISGLATAGLVLVNGSDTLNVAANASTFTMPTAVDYGSTYALSVHTQPTGLTCSFSTGGSAAASSGTMPAHNVTTVALVCGPQSYALGGTVSGLSSGTVTLANGADTLSVTSNGSFQMPTEVAYGSTYTVTVHTQPTGLTCSVGNAGGTMPAAAVTNVTVTCAVATYSIGGTVSSLSTTGMVLQDNGADNVSVAANASQFSMPTALAYGSTYSVAILTQPTGQTCTVANGSGSVSGPVTNVQITCFYTVSFTSTGAASWTVPSGVTSITVTAYGGGGAGRAGSSGANTIGGSGAKVVSTMAVQPGDSVTVYVGAGGPVGSEGGAGGGLTYVGDGASNFVIAGGGGGGGGGPGTPGNGGNAGSAGSNGTIGTGGRAGSNGAGGAAGTSSQSPAYGETAGQAFVDTVTSGSGSGGLGGGQSSSGSVGAGISNTIGNGGNGGHGYGGGGGGGGYGGGGGGGYGFGGTYGSGGGGGGGSTGPTGTTTVSVAPNGGPGAGGAAATSGANGAVTISYP